MHVLDCGNPGEAAAANYLLDPAHAKALVDAGVGVVVSDLIRQERQRRSRP